jgi:hypothetical protein
VPQADSCTATHGARHLLQFGLLNHPVVGGARVQSDDHHVQANLPAAKTTTHTIRNRNIETAKLACFLNSLRPSLTRVVRWKNTERTKRKIGIAAAIKAIILKIIVHCQCHVTRAASFDHLVGAGEQGGDASRRSAFAISAPASSASCGRTAYKRSAYGGAGIAQGSIRADGQSRSGRRARTVASHSGFSRQWPWSFMSGSI